MMAPEIPDPLEALDSALADTHPDLRAAFRDYFIGSLAVNAKPEHWRAALTAAATLTRVEASHA